MIQVSMKTIRARLELGCRGGVEDVFGTGGGKSGATFSQTYQEYATQVAQLDANICLYLKVKDTGQPLPLPLLQIDGNPPPPHPTF